MLGWTDSISLHAITFFFFCLIAFHNYFLVSSFFRIAFFFLIIFLFYIKDYVVCKSKTINSNILLLLYVIILLIILLLYYLPIGIPFLILFSTPSWRLQYINRTTSERKYILANTFSFFASSSFSYNLIRTVWCSYRSYIIIMLLCLFVLECRILCFTVHYRKPSLRKQWTYYYFT